MSIFDPNPFDDDDDFFEQFRPKGKELSPKYWDLYLDEVYCNLTIKRNTNKGKRVSEPLFNSNYYLNDADSFVKVLLDRYRVGRSNTNKVQLCLYINPEKTLFDFVKEIKKYLVKDKVEVNFELPNVVEIYDDGLYFCISSTDNTSNDTFSVAKNYGLDLTIYGNYEIAARVYKRLRKKYYTNTPTVSWIFRDSDGSINSADFHLKNPGVIHDEFYPFIEGGVNDYYKRFLESKANVLVLLGPPGTGKTSFIRNLLIQSNESALTTYDEQVMMSDRLYIRFLNSGRKFIVLEDSDILLTDRERDNNTVMNKILNASDGLISVSDKKMIFTANILDVDRIDHALIRPGRCFDVLHFRSLTNEEAVAASAKVGTEVPHDGDVTLAELFNKRQGVVKQKRKFGF